jgi:hypothetical protein
VPNFVPYEKNEVNLKVAASREYLSSSSVGVTSCFAGSSPFPALRTFCRILPMRKINHSDGAELRGILAENWPRVDQLILLVGYIYHEKAVTYFPTRQILPRRVQ